jgi:glycosyltransferase involved in cell wall biosynthesis
MASLAHDVTVLCGVSGEPYDTILPNGVRAVGLGLRSGFDERALIPHIRDADRLVVMTPALPVLRWCRRNRVRTLVAIADSLPSKGLKRWLRNRLTAYFLNCAEWVANHQRPASLSLQRIGVQPSKIIPWDWPASHRPEDYPPRKRKPGSLKLIFVGAISELKGASDLIRALPDDAQLTLYGPIVDAMPKKANTTFAGVIPNTKIPAAMRQADAIVVPSRHEYPEGLPLVILEALATRTPIIASDHPMFQLGDAALTFQAGNVSALTAAINRLSDDPKLYSRLSGCSAEVWRRLQVPAKFGDLVSHWLVDDTEWLSRHALFDGCAHPVARAKGR